MSLSYGFCLGDTSSVYTSAQFSDAIHALVGDGVALSGSRLSMTVSGFTATVGSGYALTAGRWLSNDEPLRLPVKASGDNEDRTDALTVRADYKDRKVFLELVEDVDPDKLPGDLRGVDSYGIVLYLIRVPRGASTLTPEDVTDTRANPELCGTIVPLSAVAGNALYVYDFLRSGINAEVDRIVALAQSVIDRADQSISDLDAEIQRIGAGPQLGELRTARLPPGSGWLLCGGGSVPAEYPDLSALLGGTLPDLSRPDDRYRTYIYGGTKEGGSK